MFKKLGITDQNLRWIGIIFLYNLTLFADFRVKHAALSTFYLHPNEMLTANNGKQHDKFVRMHDCGALWFSRGSLREAYGADALALVVS